MKSHVIQLETHLLLLIKVFFLMFISFVSFTYFKEKNRKNVHPSHPLQSNVYKFEIKKIRILMANKVMQINDSILLLTEKDNIVQYIRLK
jgi:hypothetical protein